MTPGSDERVARPVPWLWIAALLAIGLFFVLLVAVALHVQRTAELTLAQNHRELSETAQRSIEVQLETELLLNEAERERGRGRNAAAETTSALFLLDPASTEQAPVRGAISWEGTTQRGQLLVAGLPAVREPHEYELHVDGRAISGVRFTCPEGGAMRHPWAAADGAALVDAETIELVLRRRPSDPNPIETVVLRAP
jgi:hypothetical protein